MINPIISHKHKYIYFMIPKNACSTVRHLLLKQIENTNDIPYVPEQLQELPRIKYDNVFRYKGYFWFTFLRNPFKRVIGCYKDKVLNQIGGQIGGGVYKNLYNPSMSFPDFVKYIGSTDDSIIDWHLKSQFYYVGNHLEGMNLFCQVEKFDIGIEAVKSMTGNKFDHEHLRNSKPLHWEKYFTNPMLKDIILQRYEDDFELIRKYGVQYD